MVRPLVDRIRGFADRPAEAASDPAFHCTAHLLTHITKVRGPKTIGTRLLRPGTSVCARG